LNPLAQQAITASQGISDFKATLTYANNTLTGQSNAGPSITQVDTLNRAQQNAGAVGAGIEVIQEILSQMKEVATQATNQTEAPSAFLNAEFQALSQEINSTAYNTTTNSTAASVLTGLGNFDVQGASLLDGTFNLNVGSILGQYLPANAQSDLAPGNLTASGLFGTSQPNLLTPANVSAALTAINTALTQVSNAANAVSGFNAALRSAQNNMYTAS